MHFSQIDYSALQWAAVESITNIDHSQGRGCGGPGETIPLLPLTPLIRLTFFSSHILVSLLFLYHFYTISILFLYHFSSFSLLALTPVIRLTSFHRTFLFRLGLSTFFPQGYPRHRRDCGILELDSFEM